MMKYPKVKLERLLVAAKSKFNLLKYLGCGKAGGAPRGEARTSPRISESEFRWKLSKFCLFAKMIKDTFFANLVVRIKKTRMYQFRPVPCIVYGVVFSICLVLLSLIFCLNTVL